jgi:3-oxoadipate enol-lactonase
LKYPAAQAALVSVAQAAARKQTTMPDAIIGADHISYDITGPAGAPVVLMAHSIGTTRELWERQLTALVARYRVVRYDARGHGRSSAPAGEYSLDQLGRDAIAVLDAAGVARAHVLGLSLGGLTAMWLGLHAPERVERLVLANTAARIGTRDRWIERIAQVRGGGMDAVVDLAIGRWFSEAFRARAGDTVSAFRRLLLGCSPVGYAGCCAVLRDVDLREEIARIAAPALIIAGTEDQATTLADAELMRTRISGARLVTLPAAHLSNVEQPEAFTRAVLEFLEADV